MPKKPQDSTIRNVQSANKKFQKLRDDIKAIKARLKALEKKTRGR